MGMSIEEKKIRDAHNPKSSFYGASHRKSLYVDIFYPTNLMTISARLGYSNTSTTLIV
jgi:hypothetical protein